MTWWKVRFDFRGEHKECGACGDTFAQVWQAVKRDYGPDAALLWARTPGEPSQGALFRYPFAFFTDADNEHFWPEEPCSRCFEPVSEEAPLMLFREVKRYDPLGSKRVEVARFHWTCAERLGILDRRLTIPSIDKETSP